MVQRYIESTMYCLTEPVDFLGVCGQQTTKVRHHPVTPYTPDKALVGVFFVALFGESRELMKSLT